jgi:hypothetical protein
MTIALKATTNPLGPYLSSRHNQIRSAADARHVPIARTLLIMRLSGFSVRGLNRLGRIHIYPGRYGASLIPQLPRQRWFVTSKPRVTLCSPPVHENDCLGAVLTDSLKERR